MVNFMSGGLTGVERARGAVPGDVGRQLAILSFVSVLFFGELPDARHIARKGRDTGVWGSRDGTGWGAILVFVAGPRPILNRTGSDRGRLWAGGR